MRLPWWQPHKEYGGRGFSPDQRFPVPQDTGPRSCDAKRGSRNGKSGRTAPRFAFGIGMFLLGIADFEDFAQFLLELRIFIGGAALVDMGAKPKTVQNK